MPKKKRMLTHIDCFSGPGGICTGFKAAGLKTVLAIEKVDSCADTYAANHPEVPVIRGDIREVTDDDIRKLVPGPVDIVSSGMPCETFSTAGSKSRASYDHRQYLFREAIRIAQAADARLILFENVPAITTKRISKDSPRLIIDELFDALVEAGYPYYIDCVLNAAHFGVPQYRERFFVLASREPLPLRAPVADAGSIVTVEEALTALAPLDALTDTESRDYVDGPSSYASLMMDAARWKLPTTEGVTYHVRPNHRPGTIRRFELIEQGEGLRDLFKKLTPSEIERLQGERVLPKKWYIQRNRRLRSGSPSVTVTSHCLDELIHPEYDRALTVREVARLQSFPDAYDFLGGPFICPHMYETQDKYEQIGDAVPPLLAYAWGNTLVEILDA